MKKSVLLSAFFVAVMSLVYTSCTKEVLSDENLILNLKIVNLDTPVEAVIDQTAMTVTAELPYGTDVTKLVIEVELSEKATISPASGDTLDLSSPVELTLSAEDGTTATYSFSASVKKADYVYDFEDLSLEADSFWSGPDTRVNPETVNLYGTDCQVYYGSFLENGAEFSNTYNDTWKSWSGFAYSNMTDKETAGYTNQYSVYGESGANDSKNFAVAYAPEYATPITNIVFDTIVNPQKMYVTNSTYAYLDMKNGSTYSKALVEGDYLQLEIEGFDGSGNSTGKVEFYLADFQNGKTDILNQWTEVNLSTLKNVKKLEFKVKASQNGTPTYFCMDNLEALKAE